MSPLGQGNNSYRQVNCWNSLCPSPSPPGHSWTLGSAFLHSRFCSHPAQFGWAVPFFRILYRDPPTRSNVTLIPLGLKLLDYGYNKVSYVLFFSLYVPDDDRRQGTYYTTHIYMITKSFSPTCLFNCRNKQLMTLSSVLSYILNEPRSWIFLSLKTKIKIMQKFLKKFSSIKVAYFGAVLELNNTMTVNAIHTVLAVKSRSVFLPAQLLQFHLYTFLCIRITATI